jgi:GNAT superfamily N-acetyltransferase
MTVRHHYVVDLPVPGGREHRIPMTVSVPTTADSESLAALMLEAYEGTIDYDGETIVEARQEISDYLGGRPMLEPSRMAIIANDIVGASLVTDWHGEPLIAYVMTASAHKGRGVAKALLRESLDHLAADGWAVVNAFITQGNGPSEALFRGVGARMIDAGSDPS